MYIQVKMKDGVIKVFSPGEISAMILSKIKEKTNAYMGKDIGQAVVLFLDKALFITEAL
uniref:Uncharacterized protein n=1 Tax=Kalanchoe fedtschenkoi TaxID=63787 RepID=A0A7N0V1P8_KALFE